MSRGLQTTVPQALRPCREISQALTATMIRAAIHAGRRGDSARATTIVRGLLAVRRHDHEALLFSVFALLVAGRYRAAVRFARLAVNRADQHDDVARSLLSWALHLSNTGADTTNATARNQST